MNNIDSTHFKPAVGYLRRSTDRQEQSIGDQRRVIQAYAVNNGFDILDYYIDDAISGTSSEDRASFLRLIQDANQRDCPFKFVLVYDIKRFGRVDNDEAGYYRYQLRCNGVEIIYVSEGFSGDDTDDLLRPVKQWQARQESRDLSKVSIRGLLSRFDGGWWMGGIPPYGYDLSYFSQSDGFICTVRYMEDGSRQILTLDGEVTRTVVRGDSLALTRKDRCKLVPSDPSRVKIIKDIFQWYIQDGLGYRGVARRLNEAGHPSPRNEGWSTFHQAKGWAPSTIVSILKNKTYIGDLIWNRTTCAKFYRIQNCRAVPRNAPPGAGTEQNNEEDWLIQHDAHEALISKDIFYRIQERMKHIAKNGYEYSYRTGRGARSPYLLSGLIHCMNCGSRWIGYSVPHGNKSRGTYRLVRVYKCNGYLSKGRTVCLPTGIKIEMLEKWIIDQVKGIILKYFRNEDHLRKLQMILEKKILENLPQNGLKLNQIEAHLEQINFKINNLIDNITAENREFVDRRLREFKRDIAELENRKLELEAQGNKRIEVQEIIQKAIDLTQEFDVIFAEGTTDEKRSFIRAFVQRIDFNPSTRSGTGTFILLPGIDVLLDNGKSNYPKNTTVRVNFHSDEAFTK